MATQNSTMTVMTRVCVFTNFSSNSLIQGKFLQQYLELTQCLFPGALKGFLVYYLFFFSPYKIPVKWGREGIINFCFLDCKSAAQRN